MTRMQLHIDPVLYELGISHGTVGVVRALRHHLGLGLKEAKELVDRAVFQADVVTLDVPSEVVDALCSALERCGPCDARLESASEP